MSKAAIICVLFVVLSVGVAAQTTAFTYQGRLTDTGASANGPFDFTFKLYSVSTGGTQVGTDVLRDDVTVTGGIFTVTLDFGSSPFTSSAGNYLEIWVRQGAQTGGYTQLLPRSLITSSPYAVQTLRATTAAVADNANQLGGVNANQYVQTNDSRMTDARPPTPGSGNYIQNQTASTQAAGFNISGTGNADAINATTYYNIGGNRVLSVAGTNNFFAGVGAGQSNTGSYNSFVGRNAGQTNTTGQENAFFGQAAGQTNNGSYNAFFGSGAGGANMNGSENAFFGDVAGRFNTSGNANSFFGRFAGFSNQTGGSNSFVGDNAGWLNTLGGFNTFLGYFAGDTNTSGSKNTIIGSSADVSANNLDYATAIGADSIVSASNTVVLGRGADTVQIPGALSVTGALSANGAAITNINAANITTGTLDVARLGNAVILNTTSPQASSNFNVSGTGTANIFNAGTQYNIGGNRALSMPNPGNIFTSNIYAGFGSGPASSSGAYNSFFGTSSGAATTSGSTNSFFGGQAGQNNVGGSGNSFLGESAGFGNTSGSTNTFVGFSSGISNSSGSDNTTIGTGANVGANNLSNATAIGANAVVSQGNSLVLGNGVNVGIGTTAPQYKLHVVGENVRVEGNTTGTLPRFSLNFTGGAAHEKRWQNYAATSALYFSALNDFENNETVWLQVNRGTGISISSVVFPSGYVVINNLGDPGSTSLCRNSFNQISTCTAGNSPSQIGGDSAIVDSLRDQLKQQQLVIDELKAIVCAIKPDALVCEEKIN